MGVEVVLWLEVVFCIQMVWMVWGSYILEENLAVVEAVVFL